MKIFISLIFLTFSFYNVLAQGGMGPGPGTVHSTGGGTVSHVVGGGVYFETFSSASPQTTGAFTAVGSGNTLVCMAKYDYSPTTFVSATDSASNTYTLLDELRDTTNNVVLATFIRGNITNAPTTVSVTTSTASGNFIIACDEYTGAAAVTNPQDGHNIQNQQTPTTGTDAVTSPTITTTVNGDIIWGATVNTAAQSLLTTNGTGYTTRQSGSHGGHSEDKQQATAGSVAATYTKSANTAQTTAVVAIHP